MANAINPEELLNRIRSFEASDTLDLSSGEDLSIAVMNLISLEEHMYFSGMKTGNASYFKMLDSVREMRKRLLKKLVTEPEGEVWCISKHLLAASMRLIEVGTKQLSAKHDKDAYERFREAFDLYSMFWALNLKLEPAHKTENAAAEEIILAKDAGWSGRISNIVKKIVDCCKE